MNMTNGHDFDIVLIRLNQPARIVVRVGMDPDVDCAVDVHGVGFRVHVGQLGVKRPGRDMPLH